MPTLTTAEIGSGRVQGNVERSAELHLRLLDRFELKRGGEVVELPLACQRVMAFLALNRRALPRLDLAAAIWFATETGDPQACLRSALWRLQRRVRGGILVHATRNYVQLGSCVRVDVDEQQILSHDLLRGSRRVEPSAHVCEILCRDLLPGWYDEWVVFERERLRQLRLRALETLALHLTAQRQYAAATEAALAALRDNPLRASAQRALISVHVAEGNSAEAVRQYHVFSELLKARLGIDPPPEFAELMAGVVAGSVVRRLAAKRSGDAVVTPR